MVDYSNARILRVENVDYPIHILGVEAPALLGCFWCFMATLVINPIVAPFTAIVFGVIARQFFIEDQKGKPLTYTSNFLFAYRKISIMKYVFPSLEAITLSEEVYRGES